MCFYVFRRISFKLILLNKFKLAHYIYSIKHTRKQNNCWKKISRLHFIDIDNTAQIKLNAFSTDSGLNPLLTLSHSQIYFIPAIYSNSFTRPVDNKYLLALICEWKLCPKQNCCTEMLFFVSTLPYSELEVKKWAHFKCFYNNNFTVISFHSSVGNKLR